MKTLWLAAMSFSLMWLTGCETSQQTTSAPPLEDNATQTIEADNEPGHSVPDSETPDTSAKANEPSCYVIDVRSAEEFATGNVDGSINIPHNEIVEGIKQVTTDKDAQIYFY